MDLLGRTVDPAPLEWAIREALAERDRDRLNAVLLYYAAVQLGRVRPAVRPGAAAPLGPSWGLADLFAPIPDRIDPAVGPFLDQLAERNPQAAALICGQPTLQRLLSDRIAGRTGPPMTIAAQPSEGAESTWSGVDVVTLRFSEEVADGTAHELNCVALAIFEMYNSESGSQKSRLLMGATRGEISRRDYVSLAVWRETLPVARTQFAVLGGMDDAGLFHLTDRRRGGRRGLADLWVPFPDHRPEPAAPWSLARTEGYPWTSHGRQYDWMALLGHLRDGRHWAAKVVLARLRSDDIQGSRDTYLLLSYAARLARRERELGFSPTQRRIAEAVAWCLSRFEGGEAVGRAADRAERRLLDASAAIAGAIEFLLDPPPPAFDAP